MQLATWRDLFIERWTDTGNARELEILTREHQRFVESKAPQRTLFLVHLTTANISLPDAEMRPWIGEHVRVIDPHVAACCVVLTGRGFAASVFHTILSTATMIRRHKYPYRVSRDMGDALDWLSRHSQAGTTASAARQMYAALEERLDPVAP